MLVVASGVAEDLEAEAVVREVVDEGGRRRRRRGRRCPLLDGEVGGMAVEICSCGLLSVRLLKERVRDESNGADPKSGGQHSRESIARPSRLVGSSL